MATRALIIAKGKDGKYHYGQSLYDGFRNLEWLQKNMNDADKVEDFISIMTDGCAEGGEGLGVRFFGYDRKHDNKPIIDWLDDGYNCGIAKTKKEVLELEKARYFDFPDYISYWDGKKWKNI